MKKYNRYSTPVAALAFLGFALAGMSVLWAQSEEDNKPKRNNSRSMRSRTKEEFKSDFRIQAHCDIGE